MLTAVMNVVSARPAPYRWWSDGDGVDVMLLRRHLFQIIPCADSCPIVVADCDFFHPVIFFSCVIWNPYRGTWLSRNSGSRRTILRTNFQTELDAGHQLLWHMCYCTLSPTSASRRACLASQHWLPGVRGSLGCRPSSPELTAGLSGGTLRGLGESGAATGTTDGLLLSTRLLARALA